MSEAGGYCQWTHLIPPDLIKFFTNEKRLLFQAFFRF